MAKFLLIKPKTKYDLQFTPPLGLGFIASFLKKKGKNVKILDCNVRGIEPRHLYNFVDCKEYALIGIQAFDMDIPVLKKYIDIIKEKNRDIPIIVGGPAPSSDPERVFNALSNADYLCCGEGEETFYELTEIIDGYSSVNENNISNVRNLVRQKGGVILRNEHRFIDDLDEIGMPAWDLIHPELYGNSVHGFFYRKLPVYPIIATRGCPYKCKFCGSRLVTGYKVRTRSPLSILEELKILKDAYNMGEFQIIDDNFTTSRKAVVELCNLIIENKLNTPWTCPNGIRIDTLDEKLLCLMKEAGCYEIAVGIESGDQKILDDMNKKLKVETIREKAELINKCKINVTGFVMVGYPTDTKESIEKSMNFVLSLPLLRISLTKFIPFPGTPVTDDLIESGELKEDDLVQDKLEYTTFQYIPRALTRKELQKLYIKYFLRFTLRPHIIFKNIMAIKSFSHFFIILRKLITFLRRQ